MSAELVPAEPVGNDRLNELTRRWLKVRRSEDTRQAYRRDLESWLLWCGANGLHPTDAWQQHILDWLASLADSQAGSTRSRRLSAVSSWYQWLIRHQAMDRNPAVVGRQERPVSTPKQAPALSDAQVEKLLAAAVADGLRSAAIMYLLFTTGIRVGELRAANVGDLGMDDGVTVLHVHGKGSRLRPVEIEPNTLRRIEAYLASRTDVERLPALPGQTAAGDRPLIATATGGRVDRWYVGDLLERLAGKAGLPERLVARLSPHSTRATHITASLAAGMALFDVQRNVGHANPGTTERYDRSRFAADRSPARTLARRWHVDRIEPTEGEAS